jgi:hypothetical protein
MNAVEKLNVVNPLGVVVSRQRPQTIRKNLPRPIVVRCVRREPKALLEAPEIEETQEGNRWSQAREVPGLALLILQFGKTSKLQVSFPSHCLLEEVCSSRSSKSCLSEIRTDPNSNNAYTLGPPVLKTVDSMHIRCVDCDI